MPRHIRRESLVSAGINAVISVGFFLAVFGGIDPVPVWGIGNYAFDFVPQSFAIGFFASFVPGLLTARALRSGSLTMLGRPAPGAAPILGRAILNALAAVVIGGGLCAVLLWLAGVEQLGHAAAFALKVAYGALLGAIVTRLMLARMLAG